VFRNMLTDSAQAKAIVEYAVAVRGLKRLAVLYPEVDYGRQMKGLFTDQVAKQGAALSGVESYPFDATTFKGIVGRLVGRHNLEERKDYREGLWAIEHQKLSALQKKRALRKLRESLPPVVNFDALFIADSARSVSLIAPALAVENLTTAVCAKESGRPSKTQTHPVQLLGWTAWYDTDFDLVQRAGRYVECAVFVDGFFAGSQRPVTRNFVQAFRTANGHEPGLMEAEAYDTAKMVQLVLQSSPPTRDAFRAAFGALKDFPGVTGDTSIGPDREPQKELFYLSITAQGYQELDLGKMPHPPGPGGS
jgi:branched-chain amino acid transport system substrate-binding protein